MVAFAATGRTGGERRTGVPFPDTFFARKRAESYTAIGQVRSGTRLLPGFSLPSAATEAFASASGTGRRRTLCNR
jgi:hypothetical protein